MKKVIIATLLALTPITSFADPSLPMSFDCGQFLNIRRIVSIEQAPAGSYKPLVAQIQIEGTDPVTGSLIAKRYTMTGSVESREEFGALNGRTFTFGDEQTATLFDIQVPNEKGQSKAVLTKVDESTHKLKQTKLKCAVIQ